MNSIYHKIGTGLMSVLLFAACQDRDLPGSGAMQLPTWYLVYSESVRTSWSRKVKYMVGNSFEDLKACMGGSPRWPQDDHEGVLESRAFYAGKTASNGTDRYIWGWCPFRSGSTIHEKNVNVGGGDGNEPNSITTWATTSTGLTTKMEILC